MPEVKLSPWQTLPGLVGLVLLSVLLTAVGVPEAQAHRRSLPPVKAPAAVTAASPPTPPAPLPASPPPAGGEDPAAILQRAASLANTSDISGALELLLQFVNLHPHHPDGPTALMTMASLAEKAQQLHLAVQVYTLAAHLYSGTTFGRQARVGLLRVELAQGIKGPEPLKAFRHFLQCLPQVQPHLPEEALMDLVEHGWQQVTQKLTPATPCPLPVLEEVLALWDLTPPNLKTPAAKLLLVRLLQEKGLLSQAGALLPPPSAGPVAPPEFAGETAAGNVSAAPPADSPDALAFSQDRLGLRQLQQQRLDEAKEIYQHLEREGDQFWQLLARTRLADLELTRLTGDPSP